MTSQKNKTTSLSEPDSSNDEWLQQRKQREQEMWKTFERPDSMLSQSELVPIDTLMSMREFDRRPGQPDAYYTPEEWDKLKSHIAQHGITSPAWIDYNPDRNECHLSEGNHRLGVCKELGMTHMPAVVYQSRTQSRGNSVFAPTPVQPDQHGYIPSYLKASQLGFDSKPWGKAEPFKTAAMDWQPDSPTWRYPRGQVSQVNNIDLDRHNRYYYPHDEQFNEGSLKNEKDVDKFLDYENPMDYLRSHLQQLAREHGVTRWDIDPNWRPARETSNGEADIGKHAIHTGPIVSQGDYMMGLHELAHLVGGRADMHDKHLGPFTQNPETGEMEGRHVLDYDAQYAPADADFDASQGKWHHTDPETNAIRPFSPNLRDPWRGISPYEGYNPVTEEHDPNISPYNYEENQLETEARAWEWALQHSKVLPSAPVVHHMMGALTTYAEPWAVAQHSPTMINLFERTHGFGGETGQYTDEQGNQGVTTPWQEWANPVREQQPNNLLAAPQNEFDKINFLRGIMHAQSSNTPGWKEKYHLREAEGKKSCDTCAAFKAGLCRMFDDKVGADDVCDEWTGVWPEKKASGWHEAASQVMYHVAPEESAHMIPRTGIDFNSGDPSREWRNAYEEEKFPFGNYLTTDLNRAAGYARASQGVVHRVNTEGLDLRPDPDETWAGTSYYTTMPIHPSRILGPVELDHEWRPIEGKVSASNLMYHVAPRSARESIMAEGLRGAEVRPSYAAIPGTYYSKTAMADRTGNPQIDALIDEFLKQPIAGQEDGWNEGFSAPTIDSLRHQENSHGSCQEISEQFAEFAKQHGFKAYVTNTDTDEMGYKPTGPGGEIGFNENDEMQYGFYPEHTIVTISLDDPAHPYGKEFYIDFTASQYGYTDHPKVTSRTAAHAGAMVAIYPPKDVAEKIALENGEPAEDLHITLAYFNDKAADREDESWDDVGEAVARIAEETDPLEVKIGGVARFDGEDKDPVVGTVDSPGLAELHLALKNAMEPFGGLNDDHGFSPHLTFSYVGKDDETPETDTDVSWTAHEIVLVVGGVKTPYSLSEASERRAKALAHILKGITRPLPLYRRTGSFEDAVSRVQSVLTPDLLHKQYRDQPQAHCYAASEALYHMLGGKGAGLTPMQIQHEGSSHWFLAGPNGEIIDPTHGQFEQPVPYEQARGRGFLTAAPSKRAAEIMRRIGERTSGWYDSDKDYGTRLPVAAFPGQGYVLGEPGQDHPDIERQLFESGYKRGDWHQGQVNIGRSSGEDYGPEIIWTHPLPAGHEDMEQRILDEAKQKLNGHDFRSSGWHVVADEQFEHQHPREEAGKFTVKNDQHEVKVHDKKGKHLGTVRRCKHCGVLYQKPRDHKGRIDCPTCGQDPERVLRNTPNMSHFAASPVDAVAQSLGWAPVRQTADQHTMYGWSDDAGNQHMVTASHHHIPQRQARYARTQMTKCMNGQCDHPVTNIGAPMVDEPGAPVLRQGQQVQYGGQHYWIMDMDGNLAHIYDEKGAEDIVPTTQLRAAHFWHQSDDDLAERVRDFNEGDHPDTDPDYAFVYYQGKLEMEPWHHNISFPTLADNLLKNMGTNILDFDSPFENDTTSDWVSGCAWNGKDIKFDIPQLADEKRVDEAQAAVKKVLRGTTESRWVAVT